ncbi:M15 family metallopeptidase [Streptomyces bambusae]|uniref:M15 family metallopeptidase n=1 Tax=Streptomyces bambusae TaxID=1550616 RepID=UPI001CFCB5EE|nr:M15 family metallopeptidase [Streptomyces bambusae]MCB5165225.1 M15 family metallopeptidase [Streptomyces bambusae]
MRIPVVAVLGTLLLGALPAGWAGADAGGRPGAGPFVALRAVDPSVVQDMRYASRRNFTGRPVDGYEEPVCLLARPAALALRRAQRGLLLRGYSLKVYDCYRPQRAVDRFVRWAAEPEDPAVRAAFHPRVPKSRLFEEGYIARRSGHSRGSTVDVTLVRVPGSGAPVPAGSWAGEGPCAAGAGRRDPDGSADMGTGFDCFDPLAHTGAPEVGAGVRERREVLRRALEAEGFVNLPEEWWHFTLRPEAYPETYFDLPVRVRSAAR